jgi:hypothetical protein
MYYKPAQTSQFNAPVRVGVKNGESLEDAALRNFPSRHKDTQHFVASADSSRIDVYDAKPVRVNLKGLRERLVYMPIGAPVDETIAALQTKLKSELGGDRIQALYSPSYRKNFVDDSEPGIHTSGIQAYDTIGLILISPT